MLDHAHFDPTAGERARQIHDFPGTPRPILDPTDPRYGVLVADQGRARMAEVDRADELVSSRLTDAEPF